MGMYRLRRRPETPAVVAAAAAFTVVAFVAVKTTPLGASLWAAGIAGLQWLVGLGWLRGNPVAAVAVTADPTDLVAIPAVLVAVFIARGRSLGRSSPGRPFGGRQFSGRVAQASLVVLTVLSCIASQPATHDVSPATIEEQFQLDHSFVIARHVRWTVPEPTGVQPFQRLALATAFGSRRPSPNDACPASTLPGVELRIVPDDASLESPFHGPGRCGELALDLAKVCASGCVGGATILVEYGHRDDYAADGGKLFISLDARTFSTSENGLQLVSDPRPGEDRAAAEVSNDRLSYPFDLGPADSAIRLHAVLHVSAEALNRPLEGLHGWVGVYFQSVDVKTGFGSIQRVTVGTLEPYEPESVMGSAGVEVDFLGLCAEGEDCEIPLTLDVSTAPTGSGAPTLDPGARRDYWRWVLDAHLVALDGREFPAEALRIDGPANVIVD